MSDNSLMPMVRKLETRVKLSPDDREAILRLPHSTRIYEAPAYVVREGATSIRHCSLISSGFAFRQKLTADGARQIVSVHIPGDFLDLQHLFLNQADHNVQALTRLHTVEIERHALQDIVLRYPTIGHAMWLDALIDASIYREWVLNVGQRSARQRIAHLLCEFAVRMEAAGFRDKDGYQLPMTQEQIGDAVGMTNVHVNRMLKSLVEEGIIRRDKRSVKIAEWDRLRAIGDFSALYLHLDQASGGHRRSDS
ncbi:MAG: Crp/Fnr family transcriptional regulator [Sphingomonas bacterium]|uniref:Crp/Fnr family transcriptional regulator n=1 Tax=Sphingomonas bacterium TaxID=1895847 RepID=UPI002616344A|nr:Crp/Fnr family transcriptional regulator [Sphingomonas bacterium]MDB5710591.1 Crp/Fnr family transcriptional regulator [Sphingomonas bacterium]